MTPQLVQVARYMEERGRIIRLNPATGIPVIERYSQIERIVEALWKVGREFGISMGPQPTLIQTGDAIAPHGTLLAVLSELEIEVLAMFIMAGLGQAHARAVYALALNPIGHPQPNFRTIVDEVYHRNDPDDDQSVGEV